MLKKGFTLIEMILVLVIIAALSSMASRPIIKELNKSKVSNTKAEMSNIKTALSAYCEDTGTLPSNNNVIASLLYDADGVGVDWKGPYIQSNENKASTDNFNNPYLFVMDDTNGVKGILISKGKDGAIGDNSANAYNGLDLTIAKTSTTIGFPYDAEGDDIIENLVCVRAGTSGTPGTTTQDQITAAIDALTTCGTTGTVDFNSNTETCSDAITNGEVSFSEATSIVEDPFFSDAQGNELIFVSCDAMSSSANGYDTPTAWDNFAFVYSKGPNGTSDIGTSEEEEICKDLADGTALSSYGDDIITGISNPGFELLAP